MRSSALVILVVTMAVVCAGQSISNLTELVTKLPLQMQTQVQPLLLGLPPVNSSAFFSVGTGILQAVNRTLSSFLDGGNLQSSIRNIVEQIIAQIGKLFGQQTQQ